MAATMPFIGPVVAAWIVLTVAVMSYYFLVVARAPRARDPGRAPPRQPFRGAQPRPVRPWIPAPTAQAARPRIHEPTPSRSDLPTYDMEHFPQDSWGGPQSAA